MAIGTQTIGAEPGTEMPRVFSLSDESICVFSLADFPYAGDDGVLQAGVLIIARPRNGELLLVERNLRPGEFVGAVEIGQGRLWYSPNFDFSGEDRFILAVTNGRVFAPPETFVIVEPRLRDPAAPMPAPGDGTSEMRDVSPLRSGRSARRSSAR